MSNDSTQQVAIAGGGIGGLSCALALARSGFPSLVLEQAPEFGEVGVGLQVAPNALAVLDALGVGEAAKAQCLLIEGVDIIDAETGHTFIDIPCGTDFKKRFGNPYAVAHRADIHGALLRGCRENSLVTLRNNSRVIAFDAQSEGVNIRLSSGEAVAARALIGADGIRSTIRQVIVGDGDPVSAGAVIYRALIPAEQMPVAEKKPRPTIWADDGMHLIYYPIRDRSSFNFAATVVSADLAARGEGEAAPDEVQKALGLKHERLQRLVGIPERFNRYLIRYRDPVANWTRGPVTLLGDAAHPMVQYLAQGAAMALEDAICLAETAVGAQGDFSAAFQRYQAIRIVRSARVQLSSLMMDKILHVGGVQRLVRNSMFEGRSPEEYYDRLSWLYTSPSYVK
jgi:3-hydroxybenzoate 6-monooxygenase